MNLITYGILKTLDEKNKLNVQKHHNKVQGFSIKRFKFGRHIEYVRHDFCTSDLLLVFLFLGNNTGFSQKNEWCGFNIE